MIEFHVAGASEGDTTRITMVIEHRQHDGEPCVGSFSVSFSDAEQRMLTEREAALVREVIETPQMQALTEALLPRHPVRRKAD